MDKEIERALRGTPSTLAFRALGAAVDADLVSYCDEQLASWPDELREAPWSWLAALESGFTKPVWPLVRSLDLGTFRSGLRDAGLPDPRRPEMSAVTGLRFRRDEEKLRAFVETVDQWENLRCVRVRMLSDDDNDLLARLARTEAVARLESLVLVGVSDVQWYFGKPSFRLEQPRCSSRARRKPANWLPARGWRRWNGWRSRSSAAGTANSRGGSSSSAT